MGDPSSVTGEFPSKKKEKRFRFKVLFFGGGRGEGEGNRVSNLKKKTFDIFVGPGKLAQRKS